MPQAARNDLRKLLVGFLKGDPQSAERFTKAVKARATTALDAAIQGSKTSVKDQTDRARDYILGPSNAQQGAHFWDRSPLVKDIAGAEARDVAMAPGAARGAYHAVKDVVEGVNFLSRLVDPNDAQRSLPGQTAREQVMDAGKGAFDYAKGAAAHPAKVAGDVLTQLQTYRKTIDPSATARAPTLKGEIERNLRIGLNQGELGFNMGSLLYGGGEMKLFPGVGHAVKDVSAAKYIAEGMPPGLADYFATPYSGQGHHYIPKRSEFPEWMGGGRLPSALVEHPIFRLRPTEMSKGDFYKLHFQVDPKYYGGAIPPEFGGGRWSGKDLGWQKYGLLGRVYYGAPAPLKAGVIGAGSAGAGAAVDQLLSSDGEGE